MDKKTFVFKMRKVCKSEPTKDQWETMYEIRMRDPYISDSEIADRVFSDGIIDRRRIPEELKGKIISLEELSSFARAMSEKFKHGVQSGRVRNDCKERIGNRQC